MDNKDQNADILPIKKPESLAQEFDNAVQKIKNKIETQDGVEVIAIVLGGSLSNKTPRLSQDSTILASDADLFFFVDRDRQQRKDKKGNVIPTDHITGQWTYGDTPDGQFSEHIPKADVFMLPVENAVVAMNRLKNQLLYKADENGEVIISTGNGQLLRLVMLQAILTGVVLEGRLPDELVDKANMAADAMYGKKIKVVQTSSRNDISDVE